MARSKEQTPLVAIVTPVYKGGCFLAETMACVQAQTYPNIVHVVLDNASPDATPDIIKRYSVGRTPIITRRNPATLPQHENWEAAVRMVPREAKYFLVLCADDLIAPDAIEKLVGIAELDSEIGAVGCLWTTGIDPHGRTELRGSGLPKDVSIFDGRWFVKAFLIKLHFATSPQCTLFRRSLLDVSIPFYANDEMLMDIDACLRTLMRRRYGFVHAILGFTRVHRERITSKINASTHAFTPNWLAFIDRYGPSVMSPVELGTCRRAFLRHYFRRLLLWRFWNRDSALFNSHLAILKSRGITPSLLDYADALLDWAWLALQNRRDDIGAPRELWAQTLAELRGIESVGRAGGKH